MPDPLIEIASGCWARCSQVKSIVAEHGYGFGQLKVPPAVRILLEGRERPAMIYWQTDEEAEACATALAERINQLEAGPTPDASEP